MDVYRNVSSWKKPFHITRANLAKLWAGLFPQVEVIGITGSVGKTTTKEAIDSVLSSPAFAKSPTGKQFTVHSSVGNLDPVFNIPQTLLKIRPWTKKVVLELGIEYPGEMDFYLSLVRPKIGVITRIYWTHTEFLGDLEGVIFEKGKLLKALPKTGFAVLNYDDEYIREMAKMTKTQIFWYGSHPHEVDLQISDFLHQGRDGSRFKLRHQDKEIEVSWKLIGEHQTVAAAAAAAVGILSGLGFDQIKLGLEKLQPQPHRMNLLDGPAQSLILDDSYNSSPLAVIMALETLRSLAHKGRAIAVLGDMLELGKYEEAGHREVGAKISEINLDYLITLGQRAKIIANEAKKLGVKNILESNDITQIVSEIKKIASKDDVILVKASRHTHFERIVGSLTGKSTQISCSICGNLT